jgi:hypothetical protein
MSVVDAMKSVSASGKGFLFWISGAQGVEGMIGNRILTERVHPREVCKKKEYHDASVFFVESRNVHKIPSQMKGALCAVKLQERDSTQMRWRLCICWKYWKERDCLQIFVWKGKTKPAPTGIEGFLPDFWWAFPKRGGLDNDGYRKEVLPEDEAADLLTFKNQFYPLLIRGSEPMFHFLNQVQGCKAPINEQSSVQENKSICLTNAKDGCFECSVEGPDVFVLPTVACKLELLPTTDFPTNFWSEAKTKIVAPDKWRETPVEYKRNVEKPQFKSPRPAKGQGYQKKKQPSWTYPPVGYNFELDDLKFEVVYVEDTAQRKLVCPTRSANMVAIPYIVTAKE